MELGQSKRQNMRPHRFIPQKRIILRIICLSLIGLQTACASTANLPPVFTRKSPPNVNQDVSDPFEGLNRGVYAFNEGLDKAIIGPVARGYQAVVPKPVRKTVGNFSNNLSEPINFINEVLQFDLDDAGVSLTRFIVNSTIGLGGLFDVASKDPELQYQKEDFGQTLGTYNVPAGPYIVLPLLGPSNLRDVVGRAGDIVVNPVRRINFNGETEAIIGTNAANVLNIRAQQDGRIKSIRESADPYVNLRTLYNQSRESNIHEDSDPFDSFGNDDFGEDNFGDDELADFE